MEGSGIQQTIKLNSPDAGPSVGGSRISGH
jgi:hypothetical protein